MLRSSIYKKISVTDDKTPQQIKHLELLRAKLKEKHKFDENYTIKYVKGTPTIVKSPSSGSKN